MRVQLFHPEHCRGIVHANPAMATTMEPYLTDPQYLEGLAAAGPAFSGFDDEDRLIACVGVINIDRQRGMAWAFMTKYARYYMTTITKAIPRFLDLKGPPRVEAAVDMNYARSLRWHELMGFRVEGLMQKYTPDGRDCYLYARLKR